MKHASQARALAAAGLALAALLACPTEASRASPRIDTTHTLRDRLAADSCILRALVIYTDPYIGGRLSNEQVVAAVARMCVLQFRTYAEDLGLDAPDAQALLRNTIEAGLRGQFREDTGWSALRNAR